MQVAYELDEVEERLYTELEIFYRFQIQLFDVEENDELNDDILRRMVEILVYEVQQPTDENERLRELDELREADVLDELAVTYPLEVEVELDEFEQIELNDIQLIHIDDADEYEYVDTDDDEVVDDIQVVTQHQTDDEEGGLCIIEQFQLEMEIIVGDEVVDEAVVIHLYSSDEIELDELHSYVIRLLVDIIDNDDVNILAEITQFIVSLQMEL